MAKQVQFRRGTTSQHSTFTGAAGEITVDTDKNTAVVHDGSTAGGHPLAASLADLGVTASAADLNTTNVTTLGTVEASKVVTADANGDVTFLDGERLRIGTGSDLQLFHTGSHSYIVDQGDGNLYVQGSSSIVFQNPSNTTLVTIADTGDTDISGELIADSYNETYSALSGTTPTVNCEAGNAFSLTLSGNTTFTFSNPPASGTAYSFSIEIIQDASASGFTVTWPASVDWPSATAPTLTATASAKDVFIFTTRDGGSNWYGFTAGQALG